MLNKKKLGGILNVVDVQNSDEKEVEDLLNSVYELVQKRIVLRFMRDLSDQEKQEFKAAFSEGNFEKANSILSDFSDSDLTAAIKEEVLRIRQDLIS